MPRYWMVAVACLVMITILSVEYWRLAFHPTEYGGKRCMVMKTRWAVDIRMFYSSMSGFQWVYMCGLSRYIARFVRASVCRTNHCAVCRSSGYLSGCFSPQKYCALFKVWSKMTFRVLQGRTIMVLYIALEIAQSSTELSTCIGQSTSQKYLLA